MTPIFFTRVGEDDVEGGLLLLVAATVTATDGRRCSSDGDRSGSSHAEALLEGGQELGELQDGQAGDGIQDLFSGCH